ncbi:transposase, putative [Roseobacter sp. SK209-2-6]|nr:transposase, putative [Roseobacter sp. SK209-2-6]
MVAFQDLYSGKFLSWRVDNDPNKVMVMAAFGEMVDTWGIPKRCVFDNGHEFTKKWMTAGSPTRFRFKVREDDPHGVLTQLGIKLTWAKPASG